MRNGTKTIAEYILILLLIGAPAAIATAADTVEGVWQGEYVCAQGKTGLTLSVEGSGNHIKANFSFYPTSGGKKRLRRAARVAASGEFLLVGTYDSIIGEVTLRPDRWIRQPTGYRMVGLKGLVSDDGQSMTGSVQLAGCQQFTLKRTNMTVEQAQATRDKDKPSPDKVKPLSSARSTSNKCEVLLNWMSRLEVEYPTIDMNRIAADQGLVYGANLFLDDYFLVAFDKPFDRMSAGERKRRVSAQLSNNCMRIWSQDGRRNAHAYGFILSRAFAQSWPQFLSMVDARRVSYTWMERILAAVESFPDDVKSYEQIDTYLAKGKSELANLWPSEQARFVEKLENRQTDMAGVMLQSWVAEIDARAPTLENASVILRQLGEREKYFSLVDADQAATIKVTANTRINAILEPHIERELVALDTWPLSLQGAAASSAWYQRFQQAFSQYSGAGAVRSAESRFHAKRAAILNASRDEFAAQINALPLTADAGRRASAALNETFSLPSDRSLPVYRYCQGIVADKLGLIENAKFDAQVAAILALANSSSGLDMDGYTLPGLIGGIYLGQTGVLPDDLEQTRPQVAGLIRVMNDRCGEAPADVGLASIRYIAPDMDRLMMQGLQGWADILQSGDFTALTRNSRVAAEGFEDGALLVERHGGCSSEVRRFRSNLNDLILARYRRAPHAYNQRLFSALLSAGARAQYGFPDPMAAVAVTNSAASKERLVQQYERDTRRAARPCISTRSTRRASTVTTTSSR
jgi:hypothetical protein